MTRSCERAWEIEALREGRLSGSDADSFARHEERCHECRARSIDLESLRTLGRALPERTIDLVAARRLRQAILRGAASSDWRGARVTGWALRTPGVLAVAVAAIALAGAAVVGSNHAETTPIPGDHASAVVHTWRSKEESDARRTNDLLVDGAPAPSQNAHAPVFHKPRRARPSARPSTESLDELTDYETSVELFTARRYEEAARALHAFSMANPTRPEAEDAAFLEANALARAGRTDAAAVVAERFLDRYPSSLHALDAAFLAVRGARDRHDCTRARTLAARWIADESARGAALAFCAAH